VTAPQQHTDLLLAETCFADIDPAFLLDIRGWLEQPLRGCSPQVVREVATVLGELTANAFRHAVPPFAVRLTIPRLGRTIRIEVYDGTASPTTGWPLGRGLLIVRDICPDWGVEHRADGKIAWADVPALDGTGQLASP
jgi:hypothetical protein